LPEQKILFSGDFFGPLFPQFPNIFTMRGEKVRKPVEYINSLNRLIALQPQMIVPSHHDPVSGKENLVAAMTLIRDAVEYVHNETIAGMNAGKSVDELMKEISLPPELALTEEHGKVSWAVKSIWEYYATWFHFDSTTELYSVPAREVYPDLAGLAGHEALLKRASQLLSQNKPVHALHLLEVVLAGKPADTGDNPALQMRLEALNRLLKDALTTGNNYEKDYLRSRIAITEQQLGVSD
jgi:alkyl sulfatase BDS1-like metallo-beta-lactamase superfamily hydrolase